MKVLYEHFSSDYFKVAMVTIKSNVNISRFHVVFGKQSYSYIRVKIDNSLFLCLCLGLV